MKWSHSLTAAAVLVGVGCVEPVPTEEEAPPAPPVWAATPILEIGDESSPEYALTEVGDLALTANGELIVAQPQEGRVRVFDGEGRFVRYVGRRGQGPGEFRWYPSAVTMLRDTLWVADGGLRMHAFGSGGETLTTLSTEYRPPEPYLGAGSYYRATDGTVLVVGSARMSATASGEVVELPIFHFSADGTLLGMLPGWSPSDVISVEAPSFVRGNVSIPQEAYAVIPHSTRTWAAVAPNAREIVQVVSTESEGSGSPAHFNVLRVGLAGDTIASAQVSYAAQGIPESIKEQAFDSAAESLAEQLGGLARARRELEAAGFVMPEVYPPITDLVVGTDDRVWLALAQRPASADAADITRWLVLARDLTQLAYVELPSGFRVLLPAGQDVWGVATDDFDVPHIVRYHLSP